jgi:hypothetical protein
MSVAPQGGGGNHGYRNVSNVPDLPPQSGGPDWFWDVGSIAKNQTQSGWINFKVAPNLAVFTTFTLWACYDPYKIDATQGRCDSVTFTVVSQRTPGVAGLNGDIHAGGGLGDTCTGSGKITGYNGGTSYGDYVLAASGIGINNFKSNTSSGPDNLDIGGNGGYYAVCRPDLLNAVAVPYFNNGGPHQVIPGAGAVTVNLSCVTTVGCPINGGPVTGGADVYLFNGTDLRISGTINKKVTLVTRTGTVTITGNVAIAGGVSGPNDLPSMGVVSAGDIRIAAAATQVAGYLFSDQVIDTCLEGQSSLSACNTPPLEVDGFLMANDISFRREGVANTDGVGVNSPITEKIVLSPQIYLNPPKLFDAATVDGRDAKGQGEKQPLF